MEVFEEVLQPLVEVPILQGKHHDMPLMMKTLHHQSVLGKTWIVSKFIFCFVFPLCCCVDFFFFPLIVSSCILVKDFHHLLLGILLSYQRKGKCNVEWLIFDM